MNAKDLRIGNYVGIITMGIETQVTADHIKWISEGDTVYKPIPLTEEWMEKFGFEIHSDYSYRNFILPRNNFIISMWMGDGQPGGFEEIGVFYWGEMYIGIRTVHHLQNLFYALTGTELEIK